MLQDPLNDAMVAIRNAEAAGKHECIVRPASKLIGRVLKVMEEHEYIRTFELVEDGRGGLFRVTLGGAINSCGVIKPRFAVRRISQHLLQGQFGMHPAKFGRGNNDYGLGPAPRDQLRTFRQGAIHQFAETAFGFL